MPRRPANVDLGPGLSPREGAIDAIYRLTQALDDNDEDLLRSAFTSNATFDLSGLASCTGRQNYIEKNGIDEIVNSVLAHVGRLDSGHHLSNFRVKMNEGMDVAEVTVYAIAQHFKKGEGNDPGKQNSLIMGNRYWVHVVKESEGIKGLWRIDRFEVRNQWSEGDLTVLG